MIQGVRNSMHSYRPPKFNLLNFGLAVLFIYGFVVFRYSFNFPYLDDFDAILKFASQYNTSNKIDSILMLFGQHNEHRVFLTHIFAITTLKIFGKINFPVLIFMGNLGWFFVVLVFWRYAKQKAISLVEFLPIPIVLLSFSHWGMMTWAMTSIQQYWQILFCLLCLYFLCEKRIFFASVFFILAIFTGGGGLVLSPLIILYYLNRRQWLQTMFAFILISVLLFIYFYALPYSPPGASKLFDAIAHPLRFFAFFFGFLGGAFNLSLIGPASYIGFGFIIFFVTLKNLRQIYFQDDFLSLTLYYILLCALLGAINRSDLGIESGGASHYSVYSLLLTCCLYIFSIIHIRDGAVRKKFFLSFFCMAIFLFEYWAWKAPVYLEDRHHLLKHEYLIYPDEQAAKAILLKTREDGLFIPPMLRLN